MASRVNEYVEDRRYMGELAQPSAIGRSSLDGQPPHTTLYLRLADGIVREGRFRTSGCGYLVASCGAVIELATGRSATKCRAITEQQLIEPSADCQDRGTIAPTLPLQPYGMPWTAWLDSQRRRQRRECPSQTVRLHDRARYCPHAAGVPSRASVPGSMK